MRDTLTTPERYVREDDDFDLRWYFQALRRYSVVLVAAAAIGALAGLIVAESQPIRYEGATTLMVIPPKADVPVNPSTYIALLQNGGLAEQVVLELGLNRPPDNLTARRFLDEALSVDEVRGTRLVRIRVRLRDPKVAASASKRLVEKAILLNRELTEQEGSSAQEQLKVHLADASARMQKAQQELLSFQQRAQVDLLSKETDAMLDERGDLVRLVIAIEGERGRLRAAEEEIKKHDRLLAVPRALGSEEALRRTNGATEVLDSSSRFINPVYQSLAFQIATSRSRLGELEQQQRHMIDVDKMGGDELKKLTLLYGRQSELDRLQNSYDLAKRVYNDLTLQYEDSRTLAVGNNAQLQLVDVGIIPDRPVSRRRAQLMALGFMAGLLAACLIALVWAGPRERAT